MDIIGGFASLARPNSIAYLACMLATPFWLPISPSPLRADEKKGILPGVVDNY